MCRTNKLITNYVDMMDVDVAYVGGVCVDGACVDVAFVRGFAWVGLVWAEFKKGRSQKTFVFNLSLSFVIPVNKMNLKSLPPLNHIICKSKGFFQFIFVFCNSCE